MTLKLYKKPFLLTLFRGINATALFIYGVLIARSLGPAGFGSYSYLIVLIFLGGTVADLGMDRVLLREISRDLESWRGRWVSAVTIRLLTAIIILFFASAFGGIIGFIGGLAVLFGTLARSMDTVLLAHERVVWAGAAQLIQGIIHAATGLILLRFGWGVPGLICGLLASYLLYFIFFYSFFSAPTFYRLFQWNDFKPLLIQSWPYLLVAVLTILYVRVDLLIVTHWIGEAGAGHYSAGYRFLDAAGLFPAALAVTQTPIFARLVQNPVDLRKRYLSLLWGCFFFGVAAAAFMFFAADTLILSSYGSAFSPSANVLRVLSFGAFFTFIHAPNVSVAFSIGNGRGIAGWSVVTTGVNLGLNLFLIPIPGIIGAAWATVIGEAFSFIVFYRFLRPYMSSKVPRVLFGRGGGSGVNLSHD